MIRRDHFADDDEFDEDSDDDPEAPDAFDMDRDDDDSADTLLCPHCHKPVYEQAEQCPHCGDYMTPRQANSRKPMWIILCVVVCIILILVFWLP